MRTLTKSKTWFKLSFTSGLALFILAVAGVAVQTPKAYALCDNVNIIHCGLSGSSAQGNIDSLKHYWSTSKDDLGRTDIKKVMQWGGWTDAKVNGATTGNTKLGTLNSRTGKITVNGDVVGTSTWITARFSHGAGFKEVSPGVWARLTTTEAARDSYPVLIHFDSNGKADAGIVTDCGNTLQFNPTSPPQAEPVPEVTKCTGLDNPKMIGSDPLNYSFTAHAKVQNAKLTGATFDFGNGTKKKGTVDGLKATTTYKYKQGGSYTIVATLAFSALGTPRTDTCKTTLTINLPSYACTRLDGSFIDKEAHSYKVVAHYVVKKAQFVDADFDFGDGNVATGVKSKDGKTVSVDHTYDEAGTYSIGAILHFRVDGSSKIVSAPICRAVVTPENPPVPECKPGIPEGDIRCNPCPTNPNLPEDDKNCVEEATTLPNTGAGNVIALSSAALVGGFLWYRHLLFKRHKRAYLAADFGTSPLPLAEPLESADPLRDTPLEPKHRRLSLRRRRPF